MNRRARAAINSVLSEDLSDTSSQGFVSNKFSYTPMQYPELDEIKAKVRQAHILIAQDKSADAIILTDKIMAEIRLLPQFESVTEPLLQNLIIAIEAVFFDALPTPTKQPTNPPTPKSTDLMAFKPSLDVAKQYDSPSKDGLECLICYEREPRCLFGCGHASCITCAISLKKCPVCKAIISSYVGPIYIR